MNEQDQRTLYTAMAILGLLVRGAPIESVPEVTKHIVDKLIDEKV
jgi:hypothetical protein